MKTSMGNMNCSFQKKINRNLGEGIQGLFVPFIPLNGMNKSLPSLGRELFKLDYY